MSDDTDRVPEAFSPLRFAALGLTTALLAIAFLALLVIDQVQAAG